MNLLRNSAILLVLALAVAGLLWIPAVYAQSPDSTPEARVLDREQHLYVFGSNQDMTITAQLPQRCAGAQVTAGFFTRGGASTINSLDPSIGSTQVGVPANGLVTASIRVPASGSLKTLWPGVTSSCLAEPVVSTELPALFGVRDSVENAGASSTFVIPRAALFMGQPTQAVHTTMTAYADGAWCATVNLEDPQAKDEEGNVRLHIGRDGQPKECSTPGATVTFYNHLNMVLFETRTVVPGVTQPFENLAPKAGPVDPRPPVAGQSLPARDGNNRLGILGLIFIGGALVGLGFVASSKRSPSERSSRP